MRWTRWPMFYRECAPRSHGRRGPCRATVTSSLTTAPRRWHRRSEQEGDILGWRSAIAAHGHLQHRRSIDQVDSVIGLVAIPDAVHDPAALIEMPLLDPYDHGVRWPAGPATERQADVIARHKKLVGGQLRHGGTANRLACPRRRFGFQPDPVLHPELPLTPACRNRPIAHGGRYRCAIVRLGCAPGRMLKGDPRPLALHCRERAVR